MEFDRCDAHRTARQQIDLVQFQFRTAAFEADIRIQYDPSAAIEHFCPRGLTRTQTQPIGRRDQRHHAFRETQQARARQVQLDQQLLPVQRAARIWPRTGVDPNLTALCARIERRRDGLKSKVTDRLGKDDHARRSGLTQSAITALNCRSWSCASTMYSRSALTVLKR